METGFDTDRFLRTRPSAGNSAHPPPFYSPRPPQRNPFSRLVPFVPHVPSPLFTFHFSLRRHPAAAPPGRIPRFSNHWKNPSHFFQSLENQPRFSNHWKNPQTFFQPLEKRPPPPIAVLPPARFHPRPSPQPLLPEVRLPAAPASPNPAKFPCPLRAPGSLVPPVPKVPLVPAPPPATKTALLKPNGPTDS